MMHHFLNFYDPDDRLAFSTPIPAADFERVKEIARVDPRDPNALGSYPLTDDQAREIAILAFGHPLPLRPGMAVLLEPMAIESHSEGAIFPIPVPG